MTQVDVKRQDDLSWIQVWLLGVRPSVRNFDVILTKSTAHLRKGVTWAAASGIIGMLISLIWIITEMQDAFPEARDPFGLTVFAMCAMGMAGFIGPALIGLYAGLISLIARSFDRHGSFVSLYYAIAASQALYYILVCAANATFQMIGHKVSIAIPPDVFYVLEEIYKSALIACAVKATLKLGRIEELTTLIPVILISVINLIVVLSGLQ